MHSRPNILIPFGTLHCFAKHGVKALEQNQKEKSAWIRNAYIKAGAQSNFDIKAYIKADFCNHGCAYTIAFFFKKRKIQENQNGLSFFKNSTKNNAKGFTLRENWYMRLILLRSLMMKKRRDALSAAGRYSSLASLIFVSFSLASTTCVFPLHKMSY